MNSAGDFERSKILIRGGRNSNIELFRIVLMILLVASHYVHNSGILELIYQDGFSKRNILMSIFGMWGKPVINCFVFITGYFMCKKEISIYKWIRLIFQVLFYNIIIYLLFVITGYSTFSLKGMIYNFLPIKSVWTNFVSCYLIFYLFIPFINILIKNMDEKLHFRLVCLLGTIYVILGTIPKFTVTMNYISWFTFAYLFAAYFKIYKENILKNTKIWVILFCISYLLSCASVMAGLYASGKIDMRLTYYLLEDSNKFLAVILSFSFFAMFLGIRIKKSKIINTIARATLGVLLIHANSDLMRQWLWKDVLKCMEFYNSQYYFAHAIISVICVYCICVVIETVRLRFIDEPIYKAMIKRWRLRNEKNNDGIWDKT